MDIDKNRVDPTEYIGYLETYRHLKHRLGATKEEIAIWLFLGPDPDKGGLSGYRLEHTRYSDDEEYDCLDDHYSLSKFFITEVEIENFKEYDYSKHLVSCNFRREEIFSFQPANRYITGSDLLRRWETVEDIDPKTFITHKIRQSEILDLHPVTGGTQAGHPNDKSLPLFEDAIFEVANIQQIEKNEFGWTLPPGDGKKYTSTQIRNMQLQADADDLFLKLAENEKTRPTKKRIAEELYKGKWNSEFATYETIQRIIKKP